MAAFSYENAAIDLRQSVVQMKCGDLWLRFREKTQLQTLFWLCFYIKNAAKTRPMAAFSYENATIDLRQSVVQTKCGDLWLRFFTKTQLQAVFWLCFYIKNAAKTRPMAAFFNENAAIDLRQSIVETKFGDLWLCFYYRNAAICPILATFFTKTQL